MCSYFYWVNSETGDSEWEHDADGNLVSQESELAAARAAAAEADAAAEAEEAAEAERQRIEEQNRLDAIAEEEYDRQQRKLREQQKREKKERNRTFPRKMVKDYELLARQWVESSAYHIVEHTKAVRGEDDDAASERNIMKAPRQSGNLVCNICRKNLVKWVFLPCHHACLCNECTKMLNITVKAEAEAVAGPVANKAGMVSLFRFSTLVMRCVTDPWTSF